ncbi:siderophore-interacting protein [Pseudonocardia xinjiangensis]|jgi:NADPH-dependent ferric siderophore reductase|uniref:Siderophore-interacting protein n=1 Tax=Pseudonocardia xinjiangensis TaxID=75289 RepID=A0ABX1RI02_9PSEU|nr:siderophore-interacting protein [Pseudonocardia xinjiangensis]NMH79554.1 siderophore-interacting protein [Pseudonocardia xinjiangensis]
MAGQQRDAVEMVVVDVRRTSSSLARVVFGGPGLADFAVSDVPDEACLLHLPLADGGIDEHGRWYTIRAFDPAAGRLSFDIVTHEGGVGAGWARRAQVGDRVRISVRNSWFRRPADATWQVLLGDVAALPAIARIAETAPPGMHTVAAIEISDLGDEIPLPCTMTSWVHNTDLGAGSMLEEMVRGIGLPDGPGYIYVAGESAATRAVRKYLRHERGMPAGSYGVIGYWRRDAEKWMKIYEQAEPEFERIWQQAEAAGGDEEDVLDIYEAKLEDAGLL